MKATQQLHDVGQSLWLDNITRALLDDGTLQRYVDDFSVTGLTSNPAIFDHAIKSGGPYDEAIHEGTAGGRSSEALFFDLALEDLTRAADLFRPVHERTGGVDGWVSLEVSPLLANDTARTVTAAAELHARAQRPNLFIKIPGTKEGIPAGHWHDGSEGGARRACRDEAGMSAGLAMNASAGTLDELCINTIRTLSIDTVERADSGHPGMPMGAAVMAYVLWTRHLKHDPVQPWWVDRDRFVLSAGHASALLYSLLHLTGYDLTLDDLQHFRRWGSRTPGHPERGSSSGIEVTTGPLGQGFDNAVGMAIAERWLAATFNRLDHTVVDHRTYAIVSDGGAPKKGSGRRTLYTIGHSTRTASELIDVLHAFEVTRLVDIRTIPRSRTNPQFNLDVLPDTLRMAGIAYVHLAELGGLRAKSKRAETDANASWELAAFRNYADYAATAPFRQGLRELLEMASRETCAIMCAEAVWWRCHRRIVADHVLAHGVPVVHLFTRTKSEPASLTPFAVLGARARVSYPRPRPSDAQAEICGRLDSATTAPILHFAKPWRIPRSQRSMSATM